jgi:hypothetical protein
MKWQIEDVVSALSGRNYPILTGENELALQLFNSETMCGIGVDGLGRRVLVLPGQENTISFNTNNAIFDPWSSVTWVNGSQKLPKVSTLRCEANFNNRGICEVVAAIFIGLIDIQSKYGSAGSAIWEMKILFENGFNSNVSDETLIGLFGELVVLNLSMQPSEYIDLWHSNTKDYFDFSSDNHRLEVKTSRSNLRNHRFSSNQIGNDLDSKTTVASIILSTVEQGMSISSLIDQISQRVDSSHGAKLINIVVSTLGIPPQLLNSIKIDLVATSDSVRFISASDVPRPISASGVISMNWVANLDSISVIDRNVDSLLELF